MSPACPRSLCISLHCATLTRCVGTWGTKGLIWSPCCGLYREEPVVSAAEEECFKPGCAKMLLKQQFARKMAKNGVLTWMVMHQFSGALLLL